MINMKIMLDKAELGMILDENTTPLAAFRQADRPARLHFPGRLPISKSMPIHLFPSIPA